MVGLLVLGNAWAQYFEPPPMNPDPLADPDYDASAARVSDLPESDNARVVPREQTRVAVLGYHNFSNTKPVSEMLMRTTEFQEQMEYIHKAGLRVISMQEFLDWRLGKRQLPARCVLITLDDGWRSVYTDAYPILREYGYPFTLFLYTKYLTGRGDSMTPQMIREMQQHGATIGSHSTSHLYPKSWKHVAAQGEEAFTQLMDTEMGGSFQKLSELFGPIKTYCYPGGYITPPMLERLPEYGYVAAFTVIPGKVAVDEDVLQIHRYMIFGTDSSIFRRAMDFSSSATAAVGQQIAHSRSASPVPPFPVYPAPNAQASEDLPMISAQMGTVQGADLTSVQMVVSGFGHVPAKVDTSTGTVQWSPPLRLYQPPVTVIVSWKNTDGTAHKASWFFQLRRGTDAQQKSQDE